MKDKPKSNITCPVCNGTGSITEDATKYEFVTRDPQTNRCLVCNGKGHVYPTKKLPTGHSVSTLVTQQKRLNVSRKAVIHPELPDTGVGYEPQRAQRQEEESVQGRGWCGEICGSNLCAIRRTCETNPNPRLNKVMESGKAFLIVTETEPYYLDVFRMIRKQEKKQGSWTQQDEDNYVDALENIINKYQEIMRQDAAATKEAMNG